MTHNIIRGPLWIFGPRETYPLAPFPANGPALEYAHISEEKDSLSVGICVRSIGVQIVSMTFLLGHNMQWLSFIPDSLLR